jgi:hypothetical protein
MEDHHGYGDVMSSPRPDADSESVSEPGPEALASVFTGGSVPVDEEITLTVSPPATGPVVAVSQVTGGDGEPATLAFVAPVAPETPPTELRVHGVSGARAEDMLDRYIVGQVAGDTDAGFFRPRTEYGGTLGPGGARLEAYRWGNLTSGAAARAFWLMLIPFTLVNLPMWLRPPATGFGRRIVHGLARVFALTVSGTFVLAAAGVFLDLVAWQCAATGSRCAVDRPWLAWFFTGFFAPTGRRLALATLGPVVVVAGLWYLAHRTWARYESYRVPEVNPDGDGLATPTFWDGRAQVGRLRSLHIAAMFASLDILLLSVLLRHDTGPEAFAGVDVAGLSVGTVLAGERVLVGLAIAVVVALLVLILLPPMVDRVSKSDTAARVAAGVRSLALLLTAAAVGAAGLPRAPWTTQGPLPGYSTAVTWLFAAQAGLLLVLTLVVGAQRHRARDALLGGFGAPAVACLGLGFAASFSAAVSYRVADFLDGSAVPSPADFGTRPDTLRLQPPLSYQWAAFGFVVLFLVVVLGGVWMRLVTIPMLRRHARADTDDDFPGGRSRDPRRAESIDHAIATARLTDRGTRVLAAAGILLAAVGFTATGLALAGTGPVQLARSGSRLATVLSVITNTGTWLVSGSVVVLVLLGVQTYRNARMRRTVGVLWDLATFWPRAAHPLGPPCYAERVVPELAHRATWLATTQGGVILSGHSQGSVLVAATALQLPPAARARTALLTYGSPLRRLYQRAFPNYVNDRVVAAMAAAVTPAAAATGVPAGSATLAGPRWVNLWRHTDPIGGPVGVGDRRLADPEAFDPPLGDQVPPAIHGHFDYQLAPPFGPAVADLRGLL